MQAKTLLSCWQNHFFCVLYQKHKAKSSEKKDKTLLNTPKQTSKRNLELF